MTTQQKIQIIGAIILLLCILPMPYGFFIIVRVVTTIISAFLAYNYYQQKKQGLAITFGVVAVLFQPFFKLALGREMWLIVDVIVAVLLLVLALRKK